MEGGREGGREREKSKIYHIMFMLNTTGTKFMTPL